MRSFLAPLLASTLLTGLSPRPVAQDGQDPKPPLSKTDRAAVKKLQKKMQGAWRLIGMQLVGEEARVTPGLDLEHIGYAMVHEGFLSLEFHMQLVDKDGTDFGQSIVSGLHRFELDGIGNMETTSVIATRTRRDGSLEFVAPGAARKYRVEFESETMTLTRDDGHRLEFEPMHDERRPHFDIFGRRLKEEDEEGPATGKETDDSDGGRKKD